MVAEPVQEEEVQPVSLMDLCRRITDAFALPPPTRAERVVSYTGWSVGYAVGKVWGWFWFFGHNIRAGFNDANDD